MAKTKRYTLAISDEKEEKYDPSFLFKAIIMIREKHKEDNEWEGTIVCPKCGNELYYTIAKINKHIWGKCKTNKCLLWMM